jgi:isopenicillin-N epimerase
MIPQALGTTSRPALADPRGPIMLPFLVPLGDHRALVIRFLAFGKGDLHLGAAVLEIHAGWDDGHTLDPHRVPEFAYLSFVQQQPPLSARIVVEAVGLHVRSNVSVQQPSITAILHVYVSFSNADLPEPDRLDLAAHQCEPGLEPVKQEILETRLAIVRNDLDFFDHANHFSIRVRHACGTYNHNVNDFRALFLLDPDISYLNHGSYGATPRPVFEAYQRWQRELERQPTEFLGRRHRDLMRNAREVLGAFVGSPPADLVFTQNVTEALNIVAHSLHLGRGDEVLTSDHEYGACDRMWRFLSRKHGFTCVRRPVAVPPSSATALIDDFMEGVTPATRVIFLSHISSSTAVRLPVEEICRRARQLGIISVVDGAHTPGQVPLDLSAIGADFYGANLHKWLCAPKGAGFLYAGPAAQSVLDPLVISWGYESEIPGESPFIDHHEWWGTRDPAAFLTVPAAIEFQREHDWVSVRAECHKLLASFLIRLQEMTGLPGLYPDDTWYSQMAAAPLPSEVDVAVLQSRLYEEHRVEAPCLVWNDRKLIRISIQAYNDLADINCLVAALEQLL